LCGIIGHLGSEISRNGNKHALPLFEIARVLVRLCHVASFNVNATSRRARFPASWKGFPRIGEDLEKFKAFPSAALAVVQK
jgi:hypothetical protein